MARDVAQGFGKALAHVPEEGFLTCNLVGDGPFGSADAADLGADPAGLLERHRPGIEDTAAERGVDLAEQLRGGIRWRCDRARTRLGYAPAYDFDAFLAAWRRDETWPEVASTGPGWGLPADT